MSNVKLWDFGSAAPDFGKLGFPDLARNLELRLAAVKTLPDLEKLIEMVNPLLKAERFNEEEYVVLKRLRQRAYDKKRRSLADARPKSEPNLAFEFAQSFKCAAPNRGKNMEAVAKLPTQSQTKTEPQSFTESAQKTFESVNAEVFIKSALKIIPWFIATATISFFLWQQSLALYESAGFTNPLYSAAGGILMIIGFAAYHAMRPSWLALFLCVYALGYEGYLMVSGTIHDDKQIAAASVHDDRELIFLQEKADKERSRYHELRERYNNPESKVFKNDWFSKNHVNPAWDLSVKANEEFVTKKAALMAISANMHVTWLKIFYRLGLVFLCMVCVHQLFHSCITRSLLRG